jgi:hypothetical protein
LEILKHLEINKFVVSDFWSATFLLKLCGLAHHFYCITAGVMKNKDKAGTGLQ